MDVLFALNHGLTATPAVRAGADSPIPASAVPAVSAAAPTLTKAALTPTAHAERGKATDDKRPAPAPAAPSASSSTYDTKVTYEAEFRRTFVDLVDRGGDLLSRFPPEQLVRLLEETQAGEARDAHPATLVAPSVPSRESS